MFSRTERSFKFTKGLDGFLFKEVKTSGWIVFSHVIGGVRCNQKAIIRASPNMLLPTGKPDKLLVKLNLEQLSPIDVKIVGKFNCFSFY